MRFIIREQEYEVLIAAGRLKYRSGAVESWRLTEAVDGFQVMRIDLDFRDSSAANGLLMHVLLDSGKRLERLKLRNLAADGPVGVDALASEGLLTVSRIIENGMEYEELRQPPGFGLLLPGFIGLGLVVHCLTGEGPTSVIELSTEKHYEPSQLTVEVNELDAETIAVTGQALAVRPYLIRKNGMTRTIWLDKHGLTVRIDDDEGTLAVEDRYVRHR